jgi:hypothetical protein
MPLALMGASAPGYNVDLAAVRHLDGGAQEQKQFHRWIQSFEKTLRGPVCHSDLLDQVRFSQRTWNMCQTLTQKPNDIASRAGLTSNYG